MTIIKRKLLIFIVLLVTAILFFRYIDPLNLRSNIFPVNIDQSIPNYDNSTILSVKTNNRYANSLFIQSKGDLIVFLHGNGDTINTYQKQIHTFINKHYSVLLIEYPGYGISANYKPSESSLYSDSLLLVKYVQNKFKYKPVDTTLIGYSLGTGVASKLATYNVASKMILIAPYTSIIDVASINYPKILPSLLLRDTFDTLSRAQNINIPVLIIHGEKDNVIPIHMGVTLSTAFQNAKIIKVSDAGHNVITYIDKDFILNTILDFLK
jgi:pimeloyl-ACP methyl ester carboxylesterase